MPTSGGEGGEVGRWRSEEKWWKRSGGGEWRLRNTKFGPKLLWCMGIRCATEFFSIFFIFAGKNLDFAVSFYSFRIWRF
jgi:hypothetical protein